MGLPDAYVALDLDRGLCGQQFNIVEGNDLLQLDGGQGELTLELAAVEIEPAGKVEQGKTSNIIVLPEGTLFRGFLPNLVG
jgi:hypothetical protein